MPAWTIRKWGGRRRSVGKSLRGLESGARGQTFWRDCWRSDQMNVQLKKKKRCSCSQRVQKPHWKRRVEKVHSYSWSAKMRRNCLLTLMCRVEQRQDVQGGMETGSMEVSEATQEEAA